MDLSADTAFASPSTRSSTPVPAGPSSNSTEPLEATPDNRRDSSSTIRPAAEEVVKSGEAEKAEEPRADQASLEKEVGQVVQQLSSWGGSFWGGFKKQADSALVAVKKDLARTVSEAQEELNMLKTQTASFEVKKPNVDLAAIGTAIADGVKSEPKLDKGKGKEVITEGEGTTSSTKQGIPQLPTAKQTSDFFKNLQHTLTAEANQINANVTSNFSSMQKSLSETIANNPSLAQINRANISTLSSTIQQNLEKAGTKVNLKQAEKLAEAYLKRGEGLLEEASSFLKDAVKVVPPGEESGSYTYSWDGTDIYATGDSYDQPLQPGQTEISRSQLRLNALLRRLRTDMELLLQDPSAETETTARQEAFARFKKEQFESQGGFEGESVQKLVFSEMGPEADNKDVEALKKTKDSIVPEKASDEEFWTRYFFHKHNIEEEEKKRQQLLQAAQPKEEEDFSWDDAEAEEDTPKIAQAGELEAEKPTVVENKNLDLTGTASEPAEKTLDSPTTESAATSRRQSEESYDIVSEQSGEKKTGEKVVSATKEKHEETDEDSDWE